MAATGRGAGKSGIARHAVACATVVLAAALLGWAAGAPGPVIAAAAIGAAVLALAAGFRLSPRRPAANRGQEVAVEAAGAALARAGAEGRTTAAFVVALDASGELAGRIGQTAFDELLRRIGDRLRGAMRENDTILRLPDTRYAIVLEPVRRADLEAAIQIAARLRAAIAEPFSVDALSVFATASIGFCLMERAPAPGGGALLSAASAAADDALRHGPGAIRAFSADMTRTAAEREDLVRAIGEALDEGRIVAHYSPSLSTDTGRLALFAVVPRWFHPERGLLLPDEFAAAAREAGLGARLVDAVLFHALRALKSWDRAGRHVPEASISVARADLSDPHLAERFRWELDRFGVAPARLAVRLADCTDAPLDDVAARSVAALAALGCPIELGGVGAGAIPLDTIRRFGIRRLTLARGVTARVDTDPAQRRLAAGILSLAEQIGTEARAECVETLGEFALLSQLGCVSVQGPAVAAAMPFEETIAWMDMQAARIADAPIPRRTAT